MVTPSRPQSPKSMDQWAKEYMYVSPRAGAVVGKTGPRWSRPDSKMWDDAAWSMNHVDTRFPTRFPTRFLIRIRVGFLPLGRLATGPDTLPGRGPVGATNKQSNQPTKRSKQAPALATHGPRIKSAAASEIAVKITKAPWRLTKPTKKHS